MTPEEAKQRSRGAADDMAPEMIARRLEIVSELREWCALLGTAQRLGPCPRAGAPPESPPAPDRVGPS